MSYNIDSFLSGHVFGFLLLFARIGGVMMLFPGIGEAYVPPRTRLMFAFMICLLLLGPMLPRLPAMPTAPAATAQMLIFEMVVGLFFGTLIRMLTSALEAAGMIIGIVTGLSNATILSPVLATQSPLPSAFLTTIGLILVFITGLDHFLIRSAAALYDIFPAGDTFLPGDMAQTVINVANRSFVVGIELSAPFLVMGIMLDSALGLMQRLLPRVQVFTVTLPLEIWGGLLMFSLTIAGMLTVWLQYVDQSVGSFFQR